MTAPTYPMKYTYLLGHSVVLSVKSVPGPLPQQEDAGLQRARTSYAK